MERIVLDGLWEAEARRLDDNSFMKEGDRITLDIPGDLLKALSASLVIPDPHIALNGKASRWVSSSEWTLRRTFDLSGGGIAYYKGPDARINGSAVSGSSIVSHAVREGENSIEIDTGSTLPSDIQIIATDGSAIVSARTSPRHMDGNDWVIEIALDILSAEDGEAIISTELHGERSEGRIAVRKGIATYPIKLSVRNPELWYPNGYGYPHLYPLSISLSDSRYDSFVAFRSGCTIYEKGAILSELCGDATSHDYEHLMKGVAEANMNTLYAEGGGSEKLRDAADRYGIIIRSLPVGMRIHQIRLLPSPPSMSTIAAFATLAADLSMSSPVMEAHEDEPGLAAETERLATESFRLPSTFEKGTYLSGLYAALDAADDASRTRARQEASGIVLDKLNSTRPSVSRNAVEYSGKWKIPMYAARLFYSPVCPLMFIEDDVLQVYAVNDSHEPVKAELSVKFRTFDGKKRDSREYAVLLDPMSARKIDSFRLDRIRRDETFCYTKLSTKNLLRERNLLLTDFRSARLEDPRLTYECIKAGGRMISIRLRAEKPAFYVTLDAGSIKGIFSDNMISVRPSAEKSVIFRSDDEVSLDDFIASLKVYDLYSAMR